MKKYRTRTGDKYLVFARGIDLYGEVLTVTAVKDGWASLSIDGREGEREALKERVKNLADPKFFEKLPTRKKRRIR